ncbi:hypothetical protein [Saccharomonospora xinjiangensis]|uniref:hypothetical protein n=1 Tax=Saccharomonospora xinjiangensis TaxID=75294 RepID=UPI000305C0A7|nr:hypothetical protein [Saccharomonospora xinjiangensis]
MSEYGAFPVTFPGTEGRRYPVAVERFDIHDPEETSDSPLHASWGCPDTGAEKLFEFLVEALESGPGGLDRRGRVLAGCLAGYLAEGGTDLLRIAVAADPGGAPLHGEMHLLVRSSTATTRLSLAPAPARAGSRGTPEYRIACSSALLGDFFRINNTDVVSGGTWSRRPAGHCSGGSTPRPPRSPATNSSPGSPVTSSTRSSPSSPARPRPRPCSPTPRICLSTRPWTARRIPAFSWSAHSARPSSTSADEPCLGLPACVNGAPVSVAADEAGWINRGLAAAHGRRVRGTGTGRSPLPV